MIGIIGIVIIALGVLLTITIEDICDGGSRQKENAGSAIGSQIIIPVIMVITNAISTRSVTAGTLRSITSMDTMDLSTRSITSMDTMDLSTRSITSMSHVTVRVTITKRFIDIIVISVVTLKQILAIVRRAGETLKGIGTGMVPRTKEAKDISETRTRDISAPNVSL